MSDSAAVRKGLPKKIVLVLIISTALFFGIKKINYSITHETNENAQIQTQFMLIIPGVSGYIKTLSVQDYDSVEANQLLAEIKIEY